MFTLTADITIEIDGRSLTLKAGAKIHDDLLKKIIAAGRAAELRGKLRASNPKFSVKGAFDNGK